MERRTGRLSLRRAAPLIIIAAAAAVGILLMRGSIDFETLRANREALLAFRDQNIALAAIVYMLVYAGVVALSLPGGLFMTLAGGFVFGAVLATALTVVAATAGATMLFVAAKTGLGDALHARLVAEAPEGGWMRRFRDGVSRNMVSVLLTMRLVPAVPFFVANLAPAFMGVPLGTYVWTTFLGIIPGTAVYAWVGAGLGEVFDQGGTPDLGIIFSWPILGPLLALAALAALPMLIRALRGRAGP